MRKRFRLAGVVVSLSLLLAAKGFGQAAAINGEIAGTVTDPSGAAVAGAAVSATNVDTGYKQSVKTADTGLYRLTLLPLGNYAIEVQAAGFGDAKRTGIVVMVGQTVTVDVPLNLSGTSTTVEVSAAGAVTEPGRIDLGSTL